MTSHWDMNRRSLLKRSTAALGAVALSSSPFANAFAAGFPEHNMDVVVPTSAGGGADRLLRSFTSIWKNYLKTNFEPGFFPAASGRAGYEVYMGKREANGYNLLFGNMGPEMLNYVAESPNFNLTDFTYFCRVDTDPCVAFVGAQSKFKSIDDIIAEGKKRTLNVGTSRLAHPASIGILAVGEATGAKFNLIPLSGGRKTVAGAVTGEMDFSVLTSGTVAASGDAVRTLVVFDDQNIMGPKLNNAPTANAHLGTKIPPMLSARAFGIHKSVIDKYPDRFKILDETARKVFTDPEFKTGAIKAKQIWEYINYGDQAACEKYVDDILALGTQFKGYLTGKS